MIQPLTVVHVNPNRLRAAAKRLQAFADKWSSDQVGARAILFSQEDVAYLESLASAYEVTYPNEDKDSDGFLFPIRPTPQFPEVAMNIIIADWELANDRTIGGVIEWTQKDIASKLGAELIALLARSGRPAMIGVRQQVSTSQATRETRYAVGFVEDTTSERAVEEALRIVQAAGYGIIVPVKAEGRA